jgi:hypothetical protein
VSDPTPYPQRNPLPYPVDVPAIPATVQPGEVVTWPHPIAGFEPAADASPADPAPTAAKKKAASPAPTGEESTP